MIAIIDYGMGNLRSVQKAFEAVGQMAVVTRDHRTIEEASHLVLPGVGAFPDCMANLERYGLIDPIRVGIAKGKPFLGICLGLQLLFTESEEFGSHKGLDLLSGRVRRFPFSAAGGGGEASESSGGLKVPHMGWNSLRFISPAPPLEGVSGDAYAYFVHSYYVEPQDPTVVSTVTDYGVTFVSSVWKDNIFACQFHPEKSQAVGLQVIRNFGRWQ